MRHSCASFDSNSKWMFKSNWMMDGVKFLSFLDHTPFFVNFFYFWSCPQTFKGIFCFYKKLKLNFWFIGLNGLVTFFLQQSESKLLLGGSSLNGWKAEVRKCNCNILALIGIDEAGCIHSFEVTDRLVFWKHEYVLIIKNLKNLHEVKIKYVYKCEHNILIYKKAIIGMVC